MIVYCVSNCVLLNDTLSLPTDAETIVTVITSSLSKGIPSARTLNTFSHCGSFGVGSYVTVLVTTS